MHYITPVQSDKGDWQNTACAGHFVRDSSGATRNRVVPRPAQPSSHQAPSRVSRSRMRIAVRSWSAIQSARPPSGAARVRVDSRVSTPPATPDQPDTNSASLLTRDHVCRVGTCSQQMTGISDSQPFAIHSHPEPGAEGASTAGTRGREPTNAREQSLSYASR